MTIEALYQADILGHKNPVLVALQNVSIERKKEIPGTFYFTMESAKAPNDAELDSEEIAAEVVEAERNDYVLHISEHMEDVYKTRPIFLSADDEIIGEWKLAGWLNLR